MRKFKILLILVLGLIVTKNTFAQQDISLSMYMFNPLFVNPATAGYQDKTQLNAIGRYQWVGIEGSPKSGNISIQSPLKNNNMALGALVKYDQIGLMKNVGLDLSYAYRLKLDEKTRLSLGLMGSLFSLNDLRSDGQVNSNGDLTQKNVNAFLPNFGAGLYLFSKRYFLGVSAPHLLPIKIANPDLQTAAAVYSKVYNHYFASAGYVFGPEIGTKFKPTAFFKLSENSNPNLDINANLLFQERFWVGLGYRFGGDVLDEVAQYQNFKGLRGEAIIGTFKMLVNQRLEVGYAYDFPLSNLRRSTSGSHEIFLGYELGKGNSTAAKFISPRYVNYF